MTVQLIRSLQNPVLYPHPVDSFKLIETHISWVLLTGSYAYKIKKPLNLGFRHKRSTKILSKARPRPSILILISLSSKTFVNERLVNCFRQVFFRLAKVSLAFRPASLRVFPLTLKIRETER
jgi:hypothetical protein